MQVAVAVAVVGVQVPTGAAAVIYIRTLLHCGYSLQVVRVEDCSLYSRKVCEIEPGDGAFVCCLKVQSLILRHSPWSLWHLAVVVWLANVCN